MWSDQWSVEYKRQKSKVFGISPRYDFSSVCVCVNATVIDFSRTLFLNRSNTIRSNGILIVLTDVHKSMYNERFHLTWLYAWMWSIENTHICVLEAHLSVCVHSTEPPSYRTHGINMFARTVSTASLHRVVVCSAFFTVLLTHMYSSWVQPAAACACHSHRLIFFFLYAVLFVLFGQFLYTGREEEFSRYDFLYM